MRTTSRARDHGADRTYDRRVQLDLMIEGQEGVTWEQWLALAAACEEHGVGPLFRSAHSVSFSAPDRAGSLDAWTTIAALTARTETLRLGTLVSPATFRHPSVLAKSVVTADHVSGGRVELGLGAGWMVPEHEQYGIPFPPTRERLEIFAEQLEIAVRSWTEEPLDSQGRHYHLPALAPLLLEGVARRLGRRGDQAATRDRCGRRRPRHAPAPPPRGPRPGAPDRPGAGARPPLAARRRLERVLDPSDRGLELLGVARL